MHAIGRLAAGSAFLALTAALLPAASPALADKPAAPTITSVTAENGRATFNWTYTYYPAHFQWRGAMNGADWGDWAGQLNGSARSHTVSGIDPGNTYSFQVRAGFFERDSSFNIVVNYTDPSNSVSVTVPDD